MVYCPSCGELNEDENENCKKCGAPLRRRRRIYSRRYDRTICFGVPVASYFLGLIFGLMIILWGVTELLGLRFDLWAIALIGFGVIILVNVLKKPSHFR